MTKFKLSKDYLWNSCLKFFRNDGALKALRLNWGHEVHRDRDFKQISIYHRFLRNRGSRQYVDDNTWSDLNMNSFFSLIDRNVSCIGSQYLYHILHTYANKTTLAERFGQYSFFSQHADLREKILLQMNRLQRKETTYIPNLIFQELPKRPKAYYLIYLSSFLTLLFTALIILNPVFAFPTVGLITINLLVSHFYGRRVTSYFSDISNLSIMLDVGISLSKLENSEISQLGELGELREFATTLNKKIGWLTIDETRINDIGRAFVAYCNYFCLFNLVAFSRSIHSIGSQQEKIGRVFELVASLDANISIASYIENLPYYCGPQLNTENLIAVKDIYHPLLDVPVSNSFQIQNTSALITGSNMAGKTTFIKTIGLNIIVSQTIAICFAEEANLPRSAVKSSIKRTDDINDSKSYYFKEIEAILEFMELGSHQNSYVFLIDEIFRGTNSIERIAAATSVLKQLSQNNISLVTTHDVELQKLLKDDFCMYNFSEQVEGERHFFNYRIQEGATSSRNAIRLLDLKGYPKNVVRKAYELAERFTENGNFE